MKRSILTGILALAIGPVLSVDAGPKDDVTGAATKLAEKDNYSWTATVTVPDDSQFRPGPTHGKTEKDGITFVTMSFRDTETLAAIKGDKRAITNRDGDWQSLAELEGDDFGGRWRSGMLRGIATPAQQVADLVAAAGELTKDGDTYTGELTAEGAAGFVRFGGSRDDGPSVENAKGSATFWLQDGELTKYAYSVSGTISFNDNDWDVDRTTTVEIKDVGATTIEVPDEASQKLM